MGEKESEGHGEAYKSGRWRRTAVSGPTEEKRGQIIRKAGTAEGPEH